MAKFYESITPELRAFIEAQHLFFTASATAESRVNLSPKGMDTLRVLDARTVAYLDLTGSGNETAAHLKADGRLTIMVCSFEANPRILRLYGRGRLIFPRDGAWAEMHCLFPTLPGERQIVVLTVESLQTSCGFGVPFYAYAGTRPALVDWAEKKGPLGISEYQRSKNRISIDGLPSDTATVI
ncbi:MAG: pyridoxamine 5'-phosphate oxidase family protein [Caldilineaceae bacterium]|nr:pyridoxamine 5'-phosphate oxidase family protein [Caldilineaceae bacterium]